MLARLALELTLVGARVDPGSLGRRSNSPVVDLRREHIVERHSVSIGDIASDLFGHARPLIVGGGGELGGPRALVFKLRQDARRDGILLLIWQLLDLGDGALEELGHPEYPSLVA